MQDTRGANHPPVDIIPERGHYHLLRQINTLSGIKTRLQIDIIPERGYSLCMSRLGDYIKTERKKAGLTQEQFAMRSGLGLRFVRELEQGKETVRLDKVNQALAMFGKEAVPGEMERD